MTSANVESLLEAHAVPAEFDLLSIDVDGNDYWIGFDCGHAFDAPDPALYFLSDVDPVVQKAFNIIPGTIRTTEYVQEQCESIIDQLILARLEVASAQKS